MKYFVLFVGAILLVGCTTLSKEPTAHIFEANEFRVIDILIPVDGIEFNWHGGGFLSKAQRFKLIIPKLGTQFTYEQFTLKSHPNIIMSSNSRISLTECTMNIEIYDKDKKPIINREIKQVTDSKFNLLSC